MTRPLMLPFLRTTLGWTERFAPALTDRILQTLFLTPRAGSPSPRERRFLGEGRRQRVPVPGGEVTAWTWGQGPRVVLLHGWSGRAGQFRTLARTLVASGLSVTALDAPGHGQSQGLQGSLIHFAEALDALVGALGPVHAVVGHSLGGAALALSLSRGLPTDHAVLLGAPAIPRRFYHQLMQLLGLPEEAWPGHCQAFAERFGISWEALETPCLLTTRTLPILVVHDHDDREVPFQEATLVAEVPGVRLHATRGLGHRRILHDARVHAEIVTFLGRSLPNPEADLEAELFQPDLR